MRPPLPNRTHDVSGSTLGRNHPEDPISLGHRGIDKTGLDFCDTNREFLLGEFVPDCV